MTNYVDYDKYEAMLRIQRDDRIKSLEKIIPEMQECREKRFTRRLFIAFIIIFLFIASLLFSTWNNVPLLPMLFISACFTLALLLVTFVISFFTFGNASHEALVIEKLVTEYNMLTCGYDEPGVMLSEVGRMRGYL